MRELILAAALAVTAIGGRAGGPAPEPAAQQLVSLSGDWSGGYVGDSGADANRFEARLVQRGRALDGTMFETNTFGDTGAALFLTSDLSGAVSGADVRFTKTYDGSGGVSHSVEYSGRVDSSGRRITGTFVLAEGGGGRFEMVRN